MSSKKSQVVSTQKGGSQTRSSKNSKKKQRRRRRNRTASSRSPGSRQVATQQMGGVQVHPCTLTYAKALAYPFNPIGDADVCLPDDNDIPSFKFHCRARGSLTTNSTNFACIAIGAIAGANNQIPSIVYTNKDYVGTTVPDAFANADGKFWNVSNSPFGGSGTVPNVPLIRNVLCSLRIRYTGTELNKGGQTIGYKSKQQLSAHHGYFAGGFADLAKTYTQNPANVTRKWQSMVWTPFIPADKEYLVIGSNYSVAAEVSQESRTLGFIIDSPSGNSFEWEAIWYYEAIPWSSANGVVAPPVVTKSDVDSTGYGFVRDVMSKLADNVSGDALYNAFSHFAKFAGRNLVPMAAGLANANPGPAALTWI